MTFPSLSKLSGKKQKQEELPGDPLGGGESKVWEPAGYREAWEKGLLSATKEIGLQKDIAVNKREEIRF